MWLLFHAGQYHTSINEGITSFSFGYFPGRVVEQVEHGYKAQFLRRKHLVRPKLITQYDYLLQHGVQPLDKQRLPGYHLSLIKEVNKWKLYRITPG